MAENGCSVRTVGHRLQNIFDTRSEEHLRSCKRDTEELHRRLHVASALLSPVPLRRLIDVFSAMLECGVNLCYTWKGVRKCMRRYKATLAPGAAPSRLAKGTLLPSTPFLFKKWPRSFL